MGENGSRVQDRNRKEKRLTSTFSGNMPQCPKCKEEIDYIQNVQSGLMTWKLTKDGEYEREDDFEEDDDTNDFRCPKCQFNIGLTEEDAVNFLNGQPYDLGEDLD